MRASRLAMIVVLVGACCSAATTPASAASANAPWKGPSSSRPASRNDQAVQGIQIRGTLSACSVEGNSFTGGTFRSRSGRRTGHLLGPQLGRGGRVRNDPDRLDAEAPQRVPSRGSATVPLIEGSAALGGTIAHWAFGEGELQGSLTELYSGGAGCGAGAKVKKGTVSGTLAVTEGPGRK